MFVISAFSLFSTELSLYVGHVVIERCGEKPHWLSAPDPFSASPYNKALSFFLAHEGGKSFLFVG